MPSEPDQRTGADRRRRPRGGRRDTDIGLRDPDACPTHGPAAGSRVINVVHHRGWIYRRHVCLAAGCVARWDSYQTLIDPRRIRVAAPTGGQTKL